MGWRGERPPRWTIGAAVSDGGQVAESPASAGPAVEALRVPADAVLPEGQVRQLSSKQLAGAWRSESSEDLDRLQRGKAAYGASDCSEHGETKRVPGAGALGEHAPMTGTVPSDHKQLDRRGVHSRDHKGGRRGDAEPIDQKAVLEVVTRVDHQVNLVDQVRCARVRDLSVVCLDEDVRVMGTQGRRGDGGPRSAEPFGDHQGLSVEVWRLKGTWVYQHQAAHPGCREVRSGRATHPTDPGDEYRGGLEPVLLNRAEARNSQLPAKTIIHAVITPNPRRPTFPPPPECA